MLQIRVLRYRGLELTGAALPSAADLYERGMCLSGVSKVHGLPGGTRGVYDANAIERKANFREELSLDAIASRHRRACGDNQYADACPAA